MHCEEKPSSPIDDAENHAIDPGQPKKHVKIDPENCKEASTISNTTVEHAGIMETST